MESETVKMNTGSCQLPADGSLISPPGTLAIPQETGIMLINKKLAKKLETTLNGRTLFFATVAESLDVC